MADKQTPKLPRKVYEAELLRLQEELVVIADWVRREGKRIASSSRVVTPRARAA